jgi:beta-glucosidase
VALNPRTVVVLEGGSAITLEGWIEDVPALLMARYPGQEGGHAIAEVLFGDVNPSGRLPITWPRAAEDLPPFVNDRDQVVYGYYHGYRHVDREGIAPRFPFGHGLSYTTFAYSNLVVADPTLPPEGTLRVTVDLANTGDRAGDEIVQVYVSYEAPAVDRPPRELKGFARVALAPGETRTVTLDLAAEDLAYYDTTSGTWRHDAAGYRVSVGPSSRELPLSAPFTLSGTAAGVTFP